MISVAAFVAQPAIEPALEQAWPGFTVESNRVVQPIDTHGHHGQTAQDEAGTSPQAEKTDQRQQDDCREIPFLRRRHFLDEYRPRYTDSRGDGVADSQGSVEAPGIHGTADRTDRMRTAFIDYLQTLRVIRPTLIALHF